MREPGRKQAASPASISFATSLRLRRSGAAWNNNSARPINASISYAPGNEQVGEREGLAPFIVIAYDAERRPLLLLPLALRQAYGARCAAFHGRQAFDLQHGAVGQGFRRGATQADLEALIAALSERCEADVLALHQQPLRWRDAPNPLALLPHQSSANDCPVLVMEPGAAPATLISNSFRRRLKGKERKLQQLPGYRYHVATLGGRHHTTARLVLPHQAAADGRAETAQCVRRTRRRGIRPQRLHQAAAERQATSSISTRSNATRK